MSSGIGVVRELWRFPVKSMQGARVPRIAVDGGGLAGDRAWALCDPASGRILGAKDHPALMRCAARYRTEVAGPVDITLPDGTVTASDDPQVDARLSAFLGRAVSLRPPGDAPPEGWFDDAPLQFLLTRELSALRVQHPAGAWDVRRFRPNFVIDAGDGAAAMRPGRRLAVGGLVLKVGAPTPRCSMTTRMTGELPFDALILRTVVEVAGGHLGTYATVVAPGEVAEGNPVLPA